MYTSLVQLLKIKISVKLVVKSFGFFIKNIIKGVVKEMCLKIVYIFNYNYDYLPNYNHSKWTFKRKHFILTFIR